MKRSTRSNRTVFSHVIARHTYAEPASPFAPQGNVWCDGSGVFPANLYPSVGLMRATAFAVAVLAAACSLSSRPATAADTAASPTPQTPAPLTASTQEKEITSYSEPDQKSITLLGDVWKVEFETLTPPDLSDDGKWLAYSVADKDAKAGILVYVQNTITGQTRCITERDSPDGWAQAPRWSADGRRLAMLVKRSGKKHLAIWDREANKTHVFTEVVATYDVPLGPAPSLSWSLDGRRVYFLALPQGAEQIRWSGQEAKEKTVKKIAPSLVQVWESEALKRGTGQVSNATSSVASSSGNTQSDGIVPMRPSDEPMNIWVALVDPLDVTASTANLVLHGNALTQVMLSPDGSKLAVVGNAGVWRGDTKAKSLAVGRKVDLFVLNVPDLGELVSVLLPGTSDQRKTNYKIVNPVLTGIDQELTRSKFSWSPCSDHIAFVSSGPFGSGDIFTLPVQLQQQGDLEPHNLTSSVKLSTGITTKYPGDNERFKRFAYTPENGPCGAPLWTPDGQGILRVAGGNLWYVPINKDNQPRNLSSDDYKHKYVGVIARTAPDGIGYAAIDGTGVDSVALVQTVDLTTYREGVSRVRLLDGTRELVFEQERSLSIVAGVTDKATTLSNTFVTVAQSCDSPPDLWMLPSKSGNGVEAQEKQLTKINPGLENRMAGTSTLLLSWWTRSRRYPSHGALLLPPNVKKGQRLPLIVTGYPGSVAYAASIFQFGPPLRYGYHLPASVLQVDLFVSRGYAVLYIDIPLSNEGNYQDKGPMQQIVDAVIPGLDAAIATGYIDAERVGVYGFSFGGYMVNAMITQTSRFQAAVGGGAPSDLVSQAGSSIHGMDYFEHGQGRLGATLWEKPERYIKNSPIFYLNHVKTPLLLFHGADDNIVSIEQAEEMYRGLVRLKRPVTLLHYPQAGHGDFSPAQVYDLWRRILNWFETYLKPASKEPLVEATYKVAK